MMKALLVGAQMVAGYETAQVQEALMTLPMHQLMRRVASVQEMV